MIEQNENIDSTTEETKEIVIGDFKPKRKFLNFVSAVNGAKIRYIRDIAFVKGEKLSGQLDGVIFKVTICDEGTIKFEEVDTNVSDKGMIQRLIDDIDSMDVTGYAQKFVVAGLEFADKDGGRCYLEVEHKKPIDKLASLFEEEETKMEVSEKGLSILDQLFGSDDEMEIIASEKDAEVFVEAIENPAEPNETLKSASKNYLEEQFKRMNEEKIEELKRRIENTQKDVSKWDRDIKHAESKMKESKESLKVLETRLESMYPGDEPNGYVFYISEEQKVETGLDESTRHVADKIADLMKLKKDVLFEYLTGGYYKIKIGKKDDFKNESTSIEKEILEKLLSIDNDGKITMVGDGNFEYRGELNWHQLVGKMIRKGFEQEPDFDKFCESNSYFSKEEEKPEESKETCTHDNCGCSDEERDTNGDTQPNIKLLADVKESTDVVIIGSHVDSVPTLASFSITDDFSNFYVKVGDKKVKYVSNKYEFDSIECDGFVNVVKATDFIKIMRNFESDGVDLNNLFAGLGAVYLPNFKGEINLSATSDGKYYDFDPSEEYIQHQIGDKYEDVYANITVLLPSETVASVISDPKDFISLVRDEKLNTLGIND